MTKSETIAAASPVTTREPRPFLYLDPRPIGIRAPAIDPIGLAVLDSAIGEQVPALVRALVNHTIALQNRRELESGNRQPIAMSVLNRRRRSARTWIQAILSGAVDRATLHGFSHTWLPQLAGSGPELHRALPAARSCIEFLRGAITALVFDAPAANLLPHAHALHALETVLGTHLAALQDAARQRLAI